MIKHQSVVGATIQVFVNDEEKANIQLKEREYLRIIGEEYFYLKSGDVLEYIENGESKRLTVPEGKVLLVSVERRELTIGE